LKKNIFFLLTLTLFLCTSVYSQDKNYYYEQISKLAGEKKFERGVELCYEAIKKFPDELNYHLNLTYFLRETKRYEAALLQIEEVYKKYPDNKDVQTNLNWSLQNFAWFLNSQNKKSECLKLFERAYKLKPDDEGNYLGYGYFLKESALYDKANEILKSGMAKFPNSTDIKNTYIDSLLKQGWDEFNAGAFTKARDLFFTAYSLNKEHEDAILAYGSVLKELKEFQKSIELLEYGCAKFQNNQWYKPNLISAYNAYAEYYKSKNDFETALKIYKEALTKFSSDIWLNAYHSLNAILFSYAYDNRFKEIFDIIDDFEKLFDKKYLIMHTRGVFTYHSGDKKKGIAIVYQAYDLMIKERPEYLNELIIDFPLKGFVLTSGGNSEPEAITHAGFHKYCFDFMGADKYGSTLKTNVTGPGNNEDYYGFGMPIYSPVDGVVESLADDFDDIPPSFEPILQDGNHIAIKDANGYHCLFHHNMKGSSVVKVGDVVKKGDLLVRLGNSGFTTVPHLHFAVYSQDWIATMPVKFTEYSIIKGDKIENVKNRTPLRMELIKK